MVQTKTSKDKRKRPTTGTSPKNIVIIYEQPKVFVQRHYTKTFIPEVNPDDYEKKFGRVLLDTSTLLALIRRLNIEEDQVGERKNQPRCSHSKFFRLHLQKLDKSIETNSEEASRTDGEQHDRFCSENKS